MKFPEGDWAVLYNDPSRKNDFRIITEYLSYIKPEFSPRTFEFHRGSYWGIRDGHPHASYTKNWIHTANILTIDEALLCIENAMAPKEPKRSTFAKFIDKIETK